MKALHIRELKPFTFPVPFKVVFRHASATRRRAENLIVAAHGEDGRIGYGEGCPRDYVTGETVPGCVAFVRDHAESLLADVHDVASLRAWAEAHSDVIDANPAAFCAVETAILDLLGLTAGATMEELLELPRPTGSFRYSAVLGNAPLPVFLWQLHRYRRQGFSDFKVKLTGDSARDRRKLAATARVAERVRLDANNLWTTAEDCIRHLDGLGISPFALEEPLEAGDIDGFRQVAEALGLRIVLDESMLRLGHLASLDDPERWIINLRVSKMGGVLRSVDIARRATELGIGIIVGCQVGETSLLARAALAVMQVAGANLVAAEGAFGTHLLASDLTTPTLMFGRGGLLRASDIPNAWGSGLDVASDKLQPLAEVAAR